MHAASSKRVPASLRDHVAGGIFGALVFAFSLVAADVGSLRSLLSGQPEALPIYVIGAMFAFAPIVICGAIELHKRD